MKSVGQRPGATLLVAALLTWWSPSVAATAVIAGAVDPLQVSNETSACQGCAKGIDDIDPARASSATLGAPLAGAPAEFDAACTSAFPFDSWGAVFDHLRACLKGSATLMALGALVLLMLAGHWALALRELRQALKTVGLCLFLLGWGIAFAVAREPFAAAMLGHPLLAAPLLPPACFFPAESLLAVVPLASYALGIVLTCHALVSSIYRQLQG